DGFGGTVNNSGVFDFQTDLLFSGDDRFVMNNTGLLSKSGGIGTSELRSVNNRASVEVGSGILALHGGTNSGRFRTAAGTVLEYPPFSTAVFESGAVFEGAGILLCEGANLQMSGSVTNLGT